MKATKKANDVKKTMDKYLNYYKAGADEDPKRLPVSKTQWLALGAKEGDRYRGIRIEIS